MADEIVGTDSGYHSIGDIRTLCGGVVVHYVGGYIDREMDG